MIASTEIRIVPLELRHVPAIERIERAVFRQPWSERSFNEIVDWGEPCWVAEEEGQVVGYLITQWIEDEIHILNLAVAPNMQRKGIASQLFGTMLSTGIERKMRAMYLEVRVSNVAAIAFYEKYSFSMLATRKRYYEDGEDAYVMSASIGESQNGTTLHANVIQGDLNGN